MSSTQAWATFSRASRSNPRYRPFWRYRRSRSTSNPKRSSKASAWVSGVSRWCSRACAMPCSFRYRSVSKVFSVNMMSPDVGGSISVVVLRAAHVRVRGQVEFKLVGGHHRVLVTAGFQDRQHALAARALQFHGQGARRLEPAMPVLARQGEQPQTGPVSLLRMSLALEQMLDHRAGMGADRGAPVDEPSRRPLRMLAVRFRHVLR